MIWRWDQQDPFGGNLPQQDPDGDGKSYTLNLRFPGQYFDVETGLSYNYYRDYDPQTGRYVQSDPIGLKGGINTYLYAQAAPTMSVDLDGHKTVPDQSSGWERLFGPLGKLYKAWKCAEKLREILEKYGKQCQAECDANPTEFIERYASTGELDRALFNCACEKAGNKREEFLNSCGRPGSF